MGEQEAGQFQPVYCTCVPVCRSAGLPVCRTAGLPVVVVVVFTGAYTGRVEPEVGITD